MKNWLSPIFACRLKRISKGDFIGKPFKWFEEWTTGMVPCMVAWHWSIDVWGNKDPLILIGFRGIEGYSPIRVDRQFGWIQSIPLIMNFSQFTVKMNRAKLEGSYAILEKSIEGKRWLKNDTFEMVNRVKLEYSQWIKIIIYGASRRFWIDM